jgi:hypothetical protein
MQKIKKWLLFSLVLILGTGSFASSSWTNTGDSIKKIVHDNQCSAMLMQSGKLIVNNCYFKSVDKDGFLVQAKDAKWRDVSLGDSTVYAIKQDGTMWSSGFNDVGQLGNSKRNNMNMDDYYQLAQIGKNKKWTQVSASYGTVAALADDGSLWAWGFNASAAVGDGTFTNRSVPTQIGNTKDWKEVYASSYHMIAIKKDKSVWAWGATSDKRLNIDTKKEYITKPIKIFDSINYKKISIGSVHTLVIMNDGSLWGWGSNYYEQLGAKAYSDGILLTKISSGKWKDISATRNSSFAIKEDGTLWGFGQDNMMTSFRELLYEKDRENPRLMRLSNDKDWDLISKGTSEAGNMFFVKKDGRLYSAGENRDQDVNNKNLYLLDRYMSKLTKRAAEPTSSKLIVNGEEMFLDSYNIAGSNYFKLRDIAGALSGTNKGFEVSFDNAANAIKVTSKNEDTQLAAKPVKSEKLITKEAVMTNSKVYFDDKEIKMIPYNIDGSNYFKLRDIAAMVKVNVSFDLKLNVISINTAS